MKTIVAATDFSPASGAALREATKLAKSLDARILLVFVQDTTDIRYALQEKIPIEYQNSVELKKELARYLDKKFHSFTSKYGGNYHGKRSRN